MEGKYRVIFVTVVPSPYQRDLFASLAERGDLELAVYYLEAASPDSPWPEAPLRAFEHILPGFWLPLGPARLHFNHRLPDLSQADFIVLSSYMSMTGQLLMRWGMRGKKWLFWGERLRVQPAKWKAFIQKSLVKPMASAAGIVGIGREAEKDYARRFPGIPHFCIPYHCDLAPFQTSRRDRTEEETITFFFCGQMISRKGVDLLLVAFDRLIAQGIEAKLLLVGREANLPEFLAAVSPAARARIRYEGFQPPERLWQYFLQSDVFILPSRHDGWGVVINQALGAGLPVISSDAAGAGMDLIEEGVNGLRFTAGDVNGLMKAMEYLVTHPETARAWGDASKQKALALTPDAGAEKWMRVFEDLTPHK